VRATCHGISAACGKLGAATGNDTQTFLSLLNQQLFFIRSVNFIFFHFY
jgi:hypothetical protein